MGKRFSEKEIENLEATAASSIIRLEQDVADRLDYMNGKGWSDAHADVVKSYARTAAICYHLLRIEAVLSETHEGPGSDPGQKM